MHSMRAEHPPHSTRSDRGSILIWSAASLLVATFAVVLVHEFHSRTSSAPLNLMAVEVVPEAPAAPARPRIALPNTPSQTAEATPAASVPQQEVAVTTAVATKTAKPSMKTKAPAGVTYDGRPVRKARTIRMEVTAYSPDERSCGKSADGITASGYSVWTNGMKLVAADTRVLPFNSLVSIPGYNNGRPVPVLDRGGAIKGNKLDLLFPTHEQAMQFGRKHLTVTVWEYAD